VTEYELAKAFDNYSCIDYWYIESDRGIRGLGSRNQYDTEYCSFTIRKKRDSGARTEYEKLTNAIKNGWIFPYWFCQSYVDSEHLMNAASCKTEDLIRYVQNGKEKEDYYIRRCDNAEFYVVWWRDFRKKYTIRIYREGKGTHYPHQIDPKIPPPDPFEVIIEYEDPIVQPYEYIDLSDAFWNPLPRRQSDE